MSFAQFGYHHYPSSQIISANGGIPTCLSSSTQTTQPLARYSIGGLPDPTVRPPGTNPHGPNPPVILHPTPVSSLFPGLDPTQTFVADHFQNKAFDPALYSPLANQYMMKDGLADRTSWHPASHHSYYPYDPTSASPYGYSNFDMNGGYLIRRKNATRETTGTLKAWLNEHRKNPYPTKGEKIMLAIITKMTLTQVSTWFANARRRLKKENKMTWSPRNRSADDEDDDDDAEDDTEQFGAQRVESLSSVEEDRTNPGTDKLYSNQNSDNESSQEIVSKAQEVGVSKPPLQSVVQQKTGAVKPKIWSLADTATNNKTSSFASSSSYNHQSSLIDNCASTHTYGQFPHYGRARIIAQPSSVKSSEFLGNKS